MILFLFSVCLYYIYFKQASTGGYGTDSSSKGMLFKCFLSPLSIKSRTDTQTQKQKIMNDTLGSCRSQKYITFILLIHIIAGGAGVSEYDYFNTILEYDLDNDIIKSKGQMTQTRSNHAISVVKLADYSKWCE